jgi:hypothetical protein
MIQIPVARHFFTSDTHTTVAERAQGTQKNTQCAEDGTLDIHVYKIFKF